MPQDNAALAGRGDRQRKREPSGSLFLCQTASGIRFMRQQIAGTTPTRLRSFHTAGGIRSHVTNVVMVVLAQAVVGFHTASGMRSHVTSRPASFSIYRNGFPYRKRYKVTCDDVSAVLKFVTVVFQYRKRYEVTCDLSFIAYDDGLMEFQFRKRYEVTCDYQIDHF